MVLQPACAEGISERRGPAAGQTDAVIKVVSIGEKPQLTLSVFCLVICPSSLPNVSFRPIPAPDREAIPRALEYAR